MGEPSLPVPLTTNGPRAADTWKDELVPLSEIDPSPFQVRSSFERVESLAESMRVEGLLNAILVRPVNGRKQLVAGECRARAGRKLGWESIRARVKEMSDAEALMIAIEDNAQRKDLNLIEEARSYQLMRQPPTNLTFEQIAKKIGKARSSIFEGVALLEQPKEIQDLVARGVLHLRQVRFLSDIPDPIERVAFAKQAVAKDWSVTKTEHAVKKYLADSANPQTPTSAAEEPKHAVAKLIDGIIAGVHEASPDGAHAKEPSKHPTASAVTPRNKRPPMWQQAIEKTVGRLPAHFPLFRLAVVVSLIIVVVGSVATVQTVWVHSVVQGLIWFLWAAVAALLFEYFRRNRQLWISRIERWVELMGAVQTRDIDAIRAVGTKFESGSQAQGQKPKDSSGPLAPKA